MNENEEAVLTELIRRSRVGLNTLLSRLNQAVKDLKKVKDTQYIHIRVQLDNEGVEFLDVMQKDATFTNVFKDSEPQIEKDADLFIECEIGIFLRIIQNEARVEDALIRNKLIIRPTQRQHITPGQLARALDGSLQDDDNDLKEPIACLRCGLPMFIVGPEHIVMDHGIHLIIELWSCDACDYLEYRRSTKKPRGYI